MKLECGFAVTALAGIALGAASEPARAYILKQAPSASTSVPQVPRQIARHIILQRLGGVHDRLLQDLPKDIEREQAIEFINQYGRSTPSLFAETSSSQLPQLVLFVDGLSADKIQTFDKALKGEKGVASFTVADPPSRAANTHLFETDLPAAGVKSTGCDIDAAFNPFAPTCWVNDVFVKRIDAKKSTSSPEILIENIPALLKLASNGDLEAMLVLVPESSRTSSVKQWTTKPIRRREFRDAETVIVEDDAEKSTASYKSDDKLGAHVWAAPKGAIPACFQSFNTCTTQTNNCTGHGVCVNKYARSGASGRDDEPVNECWTCRCLATENTPDSKKPSKGRSTTHWGGAACQKVDVSVPFWLLTGFTIALIGAISAAIGMLFSVGEEKLPGVIGAGVSRNK